MAPKIYKSPIPPVPIVNRSIFTHLFTSSGGDIGGFPGSDPAFIDSATGTTITRAQLKHLALSFGFGLRDHPALQAKRDDTLLIFSPNSIVWPVVLFGSIAAGLRCTLANSAYTSRELAHQYADCGARIVLTTEEGLGTVKEMLKNLGLAEEKAMSRVVLLPDDMAWLSGVGEDTKGGPLRLHNLLGRGKLDREEAFDGDLALQTVLLCYSSGTTGKPKGVELCHQNLTSVLDMVGLVFPTMTRGVDKFLAILPFYHIYGAVKLLQFPFTCGVPTVVQTRFDPGKFCENVQKYKVTISLIVPPVLVVLARHEAVDQYDLSSLRVMCSGAAPLGAGLVKQVTERLLSKRAGGKPLYIIQGYGLSETSPTTHLLRTQDALRKVGTIGTLLPNLEARIVDDVVDGQVIDAEEGQPGELWLRGPTIMKGYWNNVAATSEAITPDRWFRTGDVAIIDKEGYYSIVDRRKELIKYKGFQVPPAELESVLLTHPDIADVAVIGVYDAEEATELPRAYIVPAEPDLVKTPASRRALEKGVASWIESRVARHKFLRGGVAVIDIIPKSPAGKILRRELRELAKKELENQPVKAKL